MTSEIRPRITLSVESVSLEITDRVSRERKRLLDSVSLSAAPGELVALLGPSGAGKSTLLQLLLGLVTPTSGTVQVNGHPIAQVSEAFRANLGYVPQDDIVHPDLTVAEALRFACRLRLPSTTPAAAIEEAISRTLDEVGLTAHRDSLIGSAEDKVLSGGQRRRVNLAVELVTDPAVLVLDEPTSGLSWTDAADVVATLRRLADSGRTILLTIHQPDVAEYETFDMVAILGPGGRLLFAGPPSPQSYEFFGAELGRPRTIFDRLEEQDPETWRAKYAELGRTHPPAAAASAPSRDEDLPNRGRPSAWSQFRTLVGRTVQLTLRQRASTALMVLQAPLLGLLIAASASDIAMVPVGSFGCLAPSDPGYFDTCVGADDLRACDYRIASDSVLRGRPPWSQLDESAQAEVRDSLAFRHVLIRDPRSVLLSMLLAIFLPMVVVSSTVLVGERTIYKRERMAGLSPSAYVLARFTVLAALGTLVSLLHVVVAVPLLDLDGGLLAYAGVGGAVAAASTAMGLALSAIVQRPSAALWGVNFLIVPQLLFAGTVTRLSGMTSVVSEFTATRPALEALAHLHLRAAGDAVSTCQVSRWMEAMPGFRAHLEYPLGHAALNLSVITLVGLALAVGFTARHQR